MIRFSNVRPIRPFLFVLLLSLACAATPDSRIAKQPELFETYPADVQAKIRAGKVDVGFDPQMVRFALGEPDETATEMAEDGETLFWGYTRSRPGVSVGLGGGNYYGGGVGMGGGVGLGSGPRKDYIAIVEFREGRVTKVRFFDS